MVYKHLKVPSTANFIDATITERRHPWYLVAVTVDAQNAFGAAIRSRFLCSVKLLDDNKHWANKYCCIELTPEFSPSDLFTFKCVNLWPDALDTMVASKKAEESSANHAAKESETGSVSVAPDDRRRALENAERQRREQEAKADAELRAARRRLEAERCHSCDGAGVVTVYETDQNVFALRGAAARRAQQRNEFDSQQMSAIIEGQIAAGKSTGAVVGKPFWEAYERDDGQYGVRRSQPTTRYCDCRAGIAKKQADDHDRELARQATEPKSEKAGANAAAPSSKPDVQRKLKVSPRPWKAEVSEIRLKDGSSFMAYGLSGLYDARQESQR
ncbi:MAG TPA: hypothetical protein VGP72_27045 [Planctomycetota bacterium]|jgi:hypothetical protein